MTLSGSKKYFLMRNLNLKVPDYGFTGKILLFLGTIGKILPNFTKQIGRKFYQASIENFEIVRNHYPKFKLAKITKTNLIGSLGKKLHGQTGSSVICCIFVIFRKFGHGNNSGEIFIIGDFFFRLIFSNLWNPNFPENLKLCWSDHWEKNCRGKLTPRGLTPPLVHQMSLRNRLQWERERAAGSIFPGFCTVFRLKTI